MTQSMRTGGPKTPEGKRVSAHNALKTGAYTSLIVLPGESEQDFRQLEDQFIHDFAPQDIVEASLVHTLTVLTWKQLRTQKIEHAALVRTLAAIFDLTDYHKFNLPIPEEYRPGALSFVNRLTEAHERAWVTAVTLCKQFIQHPPTAEALRSLEFTSPILYQYFESRAVAMNAPDQGPARWATMEIKAFSGEVCPFAESCSRAFLNEYKIEASAVEHIALLRQPIKEIKEARLLQFMQQQNMQRVHDDLDRAFYRTLSELRKHQLWRKAKNMIDVTPEVAV